MGREFSHVVPPNFMPIIGFIDISLARYNGAYPILLTT